MSHIVIIGNGVTGITCARHVRKLSNHRITVISSEGRHFFSRTALMYIYMGHMTLKDTQPYENWFWKKNGIGLVFDHVTSIHPKTKTIQLSKGEPIQYDKLVIATGSRPNKFGWPGQDLEGVQGLYSLQDLAQLEANSKQAKHAVIVGGGLIGIELAEMLLTRHIPVTFLVRESHYWGNVLPKEEGDLVARHMTQEHHVTLNLETNLKEILSNDHGRCRAVTTDTGAEIPCDLVGLTAGVHPNIELAEKAGLPTHRGFLVNDLLETAVPDIYAAGDCAEIASAGDSKGRVEQLWYTGRQQAEALAQTLCGKPTRYDRGIWFNSAKFFDIEYQTYGFVPNQFTDPQSTFYWEHPGGKIAFRLVWNPKSNAITGMNSFGIRYRHQVFERWISEKRTADFVLTHLSEANFDPEFFKRYEGDILAAYNLTSGRPPIQLAPKRSSWFRRKPSQREGVNHA